MFGLCVRIRTRSRMYNTRTRVCACARLYTLLHAYDFVLLSPIPQLNTLTSYLRASPFLFRGGSRMACFFRLFLDDRSVLTVAVAFDEITRKLSWI